MSSWVGVCVSFSRSGIFISWGGEGGDLMRVYLLRNVAIDQSGPMDRCRCLFPR